MEILGSNLTLEQREIISASPNINMCVNACPGSGKTTTIVHKIGYMSKYFRIPLEQIGLYTYNNSLGADMREKLKRIGIKHEDLHWCGTLHAYCYKTTGKYNDLMPWIHQMSNILQGAKNTVSNNFCGDEIPNNNNTTNNNATNNNNTTNNNLDSEDVDMDDEFDPDFDMDFESPGIPDMNKLKYVIFDEFQDCDTDIAEVVRLLTNGKYLTIIGDVRQQLYSYRGASAKHLLSLKPDFRFYTLTETFRCNKNICNFLSSIWGNVYIRSKINGPRPVLYRSRSNAMNNPNITKEIVNIVNRYKSGSIAIISPIVNSVVVRRFLNDIQSNIYNMCNIIFDCTNEENYMGKVSKYLISSIHQVKGLEFDTVILLNALDGKYFFDYPTYDAQCKLFVACSRARNNLFIFEHHYHYCNGSIKWITDNEIFFDKLEDAQWNGCIQSRIDMVSSNSTERNCTEFIRSLSNMQKRYILSQYSAPQLVECEPGLNCTLSDPILSGKLMECLVAIKLGFAPKIEYRPFITAEEWTGVLTNIDIPQTVINKIQLLFSGTSINVKRIVDGHKVRIMILFISPHNINRININRVDINSDNIVNYVEYMDITENNIASELLCNIYYKFVEEAVFRRNKFLKATAHLSDMANGGAKNAANNKANNKTNFVTYKPGTENRISSGLNIITDELISDLWWILRFQQLSDMSVVGFNKPDLTKEEINAILKYIHSSYILTQMNIDAYHPIYSKVMSFYPDTQSHKLVGEVDFESHQGIVEFKCLQKDSFDDAWIQVMIYNLIASGINCPPKHKDLFVYNAFSGNLYKCTLLYKFVA